MSWKDVALMITATAAVVSIGLNIFQDITKRKEHRRQIKVTVRIGFFDLSTGLSETVLFLEAGNAGATPITISSCGVILPDKRKLIFTHPQSNVKLPHELMPGKSCTCWIAIDGFARQLKEEGFNSRQNIVGYYSDQLNREHRSKAVKFNVDEWIEG